MIDEQDKDILERLQQYPPLGPSSSLRERVLETAQHARRTSVGVAWRLATVAAVLALGVTFQILRARVEREWSAPDITNESVDFSYLSDVATANRLPSIDEPVEDSSSTLLLGWEQ